MRTVFSLMLLIFAAGAWSQGQFKYVQPWTPQLGSIESRVQSCQNPVLIKQVAADDWIAPSTSNITFVTWWGTLSSPGQGNRPFYIAIYLDNGNCQPGVLRCQSCVIPTFIPVGVDCQGRTVYQFFATLPTPCPQRQGEHLWFHVAEDDAASIRPGKVDFRWSGHRPRAFCQALKWVLQATGIVVVRPVKDPCDLLRMDLAFGIGP